MAIGKFHGVISPATPTGDAHRHRKFIGQLRRRRLPELAPSFAGHQVRHVDGFLHVAARFGQHFAHLAGHIAREVFLALDQNFARRGKESQRAWARASAAIWYAALAASTASATSSSAEAGNIPTSSSVFAGLRSSMALPLRAQDPFAVDVILEDLGGK